MILNNRQKIMGTIIALLAIIVIAVFAINSGDSTPDVDDEVAGEPEVEEVETDEETTRTVVNKELIENGGIEEVNPLGLIIVRHKLRLQMKKPIVAHIVY